MITYALFFQRITLINFQSVEVLFDQNELAKVGFCKLCKSLHLTNRPEKVLKRAHDFWVLKSRCDTGQFVENLLRSGNHNNQLPCHIGEKNDWDLWLVSSFYFAFIRLSVVCCYFVRSEIFSMFLQETIEFGEYYEYCAELNSIFPHVTKTWIFYYVENSLIIFNIIIIIWNKKCHWKQK